MRSRTLTLIVTTLVSGACEPPDDVRIQELPSLARSSIEARLRLPELQGPWRFAGWELAEGDTLGLEAELPALGVVWLQAQKRDSLAGFYLTGGGRAPLQGEVRRNGVVALVAFPQPGDGRYLVGSVEADTLWVESTTLVDQGVWREDSRAAFVRSQTALTPFRRVRGLAPPRPAVDSAALAGGMDTVPPGPTDGVTTGGVIREPTVGVPGRTTTPRPGQVTPSRPVIPRATPVPTEEDAEAQAEPEEFVPQIAPVIEEREPPRVLGVPVERDTAGEGQLP